MPPEKLPNYGGQAIIEGVMMRGAKAVAIAVRAPDGEIIVHTKNIEGADRKKIIKIPFIRGIFILWDALKLGLFALTMSANVQTGEDEKLEGPFLYLTLSFSLLLAVSLFILLPGFAGDFLASWTGLNAWWANLFEGFFRLMILIGYIWVIGKWQEIERVFRYHGAEHKTINAFEAGEPLTVETVHKQTLVHPRCGTSFLLTVVLLSVIFFSVLGPLGWMAKMVARLLMVFPLASVAYEYIRWTAKHLDSPLVRALIKPNLALQSLTTRQPTYDMLEIAITAFNTMLEKETEFNHPDS
jgi:uncharacterized protein YqhQ